MAKNTSRSTVKTIVGRKQPFFSGSKLYIALGGISLVGFLSLSAVAASLLKAPTPPEVASIEPAIATDENLPPQTVEAVVVDSEVVEPSQQSAYAHFLSHAAMRAESAGNITRSALSSSDWDLVVARWQEAIQVVDQIPEGDPLHSEAQAKKADYLIALSYARQGKPVPDATATFSEAVNAATEASQRTQQARTAEEWRSVAEKWGEASVRMGQVPGFAENYQLAQDKAKEYASNQNYALAQASRPVSPAPVAAPPAPVVTSTSPAIAPITTSPATTSTATSSGSSSGSSGSGSCDYPWDYDSAGRRCGDRAASVREGGRLGGSGSSSSTSASSGTGSNCHYVSGYTRKNGTRVRGYTRCR